MAQIKSKKRVKDFAEVFTNPREVNAMLDLIPDFSIEQTYLEPACGNGAFLTEIIRRKLELCETADDVITAYQSVYGVDIQMDNVIESRNALISLVPTHIAGLDTIAKVAFILERNIVQGDFLNPDSVWFLRGLTPHAAPNNLPRRNARTGKNAQTAKRNSVETEHT